MYNAEKVADVVEEINRRRDMIHQDAGNLNKIEYIIIAGNLNKTTVQRRESSRRC